MSEKVELKAARVIRNNDGRTTLSSLTAQLGIDRLSALTALKMLMQKYRCNMKVTDDGGLIYDFGRDFSPIESDYHPITWFFLVLWDLWQTWMIFVIWGTVGSLRYLSSILGFFARLSHKREPANKGLPLYADDNSDIDNTTGEKTLEALARPDDARRATEFTMPERGIARYFSIKDRLHAELINLKQWKVPGYKRNKLFMSYVNRVGGVVTSMEWAVLFDTDLREAEDRITELYAEYDADVKVSDDGELVFDFSAALGKDFGPKPPPRFYTLTVMQEVMEAGSRPFLYAYTMIMLLGFAIIWLGVPLFSLLSANDIIIHIPPIIGTTMLSVGIVVLIISAFLNEHFFRVLFIGLILGGLVGVAVALIGGQDKYFMIGAAVTAASIFLLWGIAALLAFFTLIPNVIKLTGLLKNNNLWFRMALHAWLMQSDAGIPTDSREAATALSSVVAYPVPVPSEKGFTMAIAALGGDLLAPDDPEKPAFFVFPRIRAQKKAVRDFTPEHKAMNEDAVVYTSEQGDVIASPKIDTPSNDQSEPAQTKPSVPKAIPADECDRENIAKQVGLILRWKKWSEEPSSSLTTIFIMFAVLVIGGGIYLWLFVYNGDLAWWKIVLYVLVGLGGPAILFSGMEDRSDRRVREKWLDLLQDRLEKTLDSVDSVGRPLVVIQVQWNHMSASHGGYSTISIGLSLWSECGKGTEIIEFSTGDYEWDSWGEVCDMLFNLLRDEVPPKQWVWAVVEMENDNILNIIQPDLPDTGPSLEDWMDNTAEVYKNIEGQLRKTDWWPLKSNTGMS